MKHLHPPIILGRVNAIDPYIDEQWDCLNPSGGCYIALEIGNEECLEVVHKRAGTDMLGRISFLDQVEGLVNPLWRGCQCSRRQ
jgi:hypothetical protein